MLWSLCGIWGCKTGPNSGHSPAPEPVKVPDPSVGFRDVPPQPDHHEDRQQPMATPVARAVPRHDGRNDAIIDVNKASPHNLHGAMFGNIDPIPGAWWMFKTIFTLIRRS